MYQESCIAGARVSGWPRNEIALRSFLASRMAALGDGAKLLAGEKGARIVTEISTGLEQPGPITRRLNRRLTELLEIFTLENVHDEATEEAQHFAALDPGDPVVTELCLLTDELRRALHSAGIDPNCERAH